MVATVATEPSAPTATEPLLVLDPDSFPAFADLLQAAQPYARVSGGRFRKRDFAGEHDETMGAPPAAVAKAAESCAAEVATFAEILRLSEGSADASRLGSDVDRAHKMVSAEGVLNAMEATFKQLGLWPVPGADKETDLCYQDTGIPLEETAARLWCFKKMRSDAASAEVEAFRKRRIVTASFVVDFATANGVQPTEDNSSKELLDDFVKRVCEYSERTGKKVEKNRLLRELKRLLPPTWDLDQMWDDHAPALLGVTAAVGVCALAAFAIHAKAKSRA